MSYPRSLIPLLLRGGRDRDDWWDYPGYWDYPTGPSRLHEQHFGGHATDDDLYSALPPRAALARQFSRTLSRPARGVIGAAGGFSDVTNDATQFQVKMDVAHFGPSEITVKAVEGNAIVIEGRHEEKQDDHGFISRQFSRKYILPRDVEVDKITSSLTPEGVLTVIAPKKNLEAIKGGEKVIPVTMAIDSDPSPMSPASAEPRF